jgi:predicted nucleotidyltransferase
MQNVDEYLHTLAKQSETILGDSFVGCYSLGSYSMGGYIQGKSDLDVAVICSHSLDTTTKETIVNKLSHQVLPCPAQKLELVVYTLDAVSHPVNKAAFEINFNTGAVLNSDHICFESENEPAHWFIIDRAVAHKHAIALAGPDRSEVFTEIPRQWILEAIYNCLIWHKNNQEIAGQWNVMANAARAWKWAVDGVWLIKSAAVQWASEQNADHDIMDQAISQIKQEISKYN